MLVGDASTLELPAQGVRAVRDIVGQPDDTSFTNLMRECHQDLEEDSIRSIQLVRRVDEYPLAQGGPSFGKA